MRIHTVTDLRLPELQPYRTLRRPAEHLKEGFFVAEGVKVVDRLLATPMMILSILMTPELFEQRRHVLETGFPSLDVYLGKKELLEGIVGFHLHQGIMAIAKVPEPRDLMDVMRSARRPSLLLAVDDLVNAENVGVIVRNARAFGVSAILVGETSSSPFLRRAVRNSMGSVFTLPVVHSKDLAHTLREISAIDGMNVLAVESGRSGKPIGEVNLTGDVCLVVGGEGNGIRPSVEAACGGTVEIPMAGGMDSLNVANAAAVCLYEVQRQRTRAGGGS